MNLGQRDPFWKEGRLGRGGFRSKDEVDGGTTGSITEVSVGFKWCMVSPETGSGWYTGKELEEGEPPFGGRVDESVVATV